MSVDDYRAAREELRAAYTTGDWHAHLARDRGFVRALPESAERMHCLAALDMLELFAKEGDRRRQPAKHDENVRKIREKQ